MNKKSIRFILLLVLSMLPPLGVRAEENKALKPGMDESMMAQMKEKSMPGENHKFLEQLAGDWDHTAVWRMAPDAEPMTSHGTTKNQMIFGGRFLKQEVEGNMNGEKFEGIGFTGYDTIKKEYDSVWIDGMGTGMMVSSSQYDPTAKTFSEHGTFSCPMTGEANREFRGEWKILSPDNYVYEMYNKAPDGREFKSMEITYKRK